jgi:hypothetical protein
VIPEDQQREDEATAAGQLDGRKTHMALYGPENRKIPIGFAAALWTL